MHLSCLHWCISRLANVVAIIHTLKIVDYNIKSCKLYEASTTVSWLFDIILKPYVNPKVVRFESGTLSTCQNSLGLVLKMRMKDKTKMHSKHHTTQKFICLCPFYLSHFISTYFTCFLLKTRFFLFLVGSLQR